MTKTMPHGDGSPSKAIVAGGSGDSATTAIAAAGRLPYPMLTTTNYAAWALRMKYLLRVNGAWGAVDPENSSKSKAVDEIKEELAMTIISQSIDDGTLLRVAENETAADVWAVLRSMHVGVEHVREARIQSLHSEFDRLKMGDAESVDDFAARFTTLVGRIRELGDKMEEKYIVKKLLRAVSTKIIHVASSIMMFGDINNMAMEEAIGSLKVHEELIKGREAETEEQLMMARGSGRGRGSGEWRKDKSKVQCFSCEDYGHFAWECPEKKKNQAREEEEEGAAAASCSDIRRTSTSLKPRDDQVENQD